MFGVGDTVVYGSQGVCRIAGKEQRRLGIRYADYFVLRPVFDDNSTVYVPCANEKLLAKMKPVMTRSEAEAMADSFINDEPDWISEDNERKLRYQEIIDSGDRAGILMIIKSLYRHRDRQEKRGRHLHQNDESLLKQSERLMFGELALALELRPDQVLAYIKERAAGSYRSAAVGG